MGRIFLCYLVNFLLISANAADIRHLNIWPMPKSVSYGHGSLYLGSDFELKTEGTKFVDSSGILKDAFLRTIDVVKGNHVIESNSSKFDSSFVLKGIHVVVFSPSDELQHGVDESYELHIPARGNLLYAHIEAKTVYGALHALQTFSQVCYFNFTSRGIVVHQVPWTIVDQPRFSYRGLLIDTSRHYQPLPVIKKVIDSMTYAKLIHSLSLLRYLRIRTYGMVHIPFQNVIHLLMLQKFYAKNRGINVLAEIDVPGHAQSWGVGYPSLWPSIDCKEPLDVSNESTFKLIDGILSDFSKIFKYKFVHLGGDEVNTSCWQSTPHVHKWLQKNKMNGSEAYQYFVLRAQKIALSHGYEIINWEETFNNFGSKLSRKTVVHNWLGSGVAQRVVEAGLRCIVSNQDKWYLDHLDAIWQGFYINEPLTNITDPKQQSLVLGGEVCMWGEHIDGSDIEQTIWPRAAAAAERLWTPYDMLAKDPEQVRSRLSHFRCLLNQRGVAAAPLDGLERLWTPYDMLAKDPEQVRSRLSHFRCLLNQRGVAAAPLDGLGRSAPEDPGSCYLQ
ncbi:hypothetical protein RD792_003616 [Penstemon davidsonii]|uniref:Beta-hexosaminidase n=1 Tax=Penstemon davidsonii TaxID=160366 RepID=A0ABR0DF59_9LAMI|nr:hypothetical protein RD792_003616 [Penstemon davidsonii]